MRGKAYRRYRVELAKERSLRYIIERSDYQPYQYKDKAYAYAGLLWDIVPLELIRKIGQAAAVHNRMCNCDGCVSGRRSRWTDGMGNFTRQERINKNRYEDDLKDLCIESKHRWKA